ncbi:MAG TPA: class I adenylate-forming enzyme family protein, partial [Methanocorpusculum sp.]|nr:class I adenylate-forming enzyme family protein [Methanocorpusculum sp.]
KLCEGLGAKIINCDTTTYFPKSPKGFVLKYGYKFLNRNIEKSKESIRGTDIFDAGKAFLKEGGKLPKDTMKAEDTAAIMYTGGTTGDSKGVILSNAAINASTSEMILEKLDNAPHIGIAFLSVLPVFHAFGLSIVIHAPLSGGMRAVLMPNFDTKKCANTILKEKIEIIAGVPAMFERMYPLLKDNDLSFIKHMVSGGDKVSPELVARYNEIMNTQFLPGYGLTEACGACLLTKLGYKEFPEGCVGRPLRKNTICLVEPGTTTPAENEGELCIRGPMLMDGYFNNPEATADVMRLHDDGLVWLHTGDVVTLDEEQNVIFKSRYKRMLKVNGYNVYPTIIENTMEKCPAIAEVCAVGMPWKNGDTRVKLYVTLADKNANEEAAIAEIKAYASEQMNRWHQPKEVRVIEKFPMTKMNKVDYKVLEKGL